MDAYSNEPISLLKGSGRTEDRPQSSIAAAGGEGGGPVDPFETQLVAALNAAKHVDFSALRAAVEFLARDGDDAEVLEQHAILSSIMADIRALDVVLAEDQTNLKE